MPNVDRRRRERAPDSEGSDIAELASKYRARDASRSEFPAQAKPALPVDIRGAARQHPRVDKGGEDAEHEGSSPFERAAADTPAPERTA